MSLRVTGRLLNPGEWPPKRPPQERPKALCALYRPILRRGDGLGTGLHEVKVRDEVHLKSRVLIRVVADLAARRPSVDPGRCARGTACRRTKTSKHRG